MHEEQQQCILYCSSTFTIPAVIKLFTFNFNFFQNQLLAIAKSFRYLFDITIDLHTLKLGGVVK
jgi:hypothetical protein